MARAGKAIRRPSTVKDQNPGFRLFSRRYRHARFPLHWEGYSEVATSYSIRPAAGESPASLQVYSSDSVASFKTLSRIVCCISVSAPSTFSIRNSTVSAVVNSLNREADNCTLA